MNTILQRLNLEITPIIAYGLVFLAVILAGVGLDRLSTLEKDIETKVAAAKNELIILEGIKDTDIWADRLALSLNARQSADNKMWTGPTSGVIAARLQQTLRNISKAHNIQNIRLRIDPEPTNVDTVQVLAFDLQGAAPETRTTVDILSGFASHPQIILIKEATITNTVRNRPPTHINISGFAPIRIQAAPAAASSPATPDADNSVPAGL